MTRSTKTFLFAIFSALIAWLAGVVMVGRAVIRHTTSTGPVDMENAGQIARALQDPTFTATVSWGDIVLHGKAWPLVLPITLAAIAFGAVYISAAFIGKGRA